MTLDLNDSVQKWRNHFQSMARGNIPTEEVYFMNQRGRGLGSTGKSRAFYKIQSGGQPYSSSIPSPASKGYAMAMGRIMDSKKRKKSRITRQKRSSTGIKRRSRSGGVKKVVRRARRHIKSIKRRKTTTKRKTTKRKSTTKRKTPTRKRTRKQKINDIFL